MKGEAALIYIPPQIVILSESGIFSRSMFASGQKRTLMHIRSMSVLPPKADIAERN